MGAVANAIKDVIRLGGGQGYTTPISRDVVYNDPGGVAWGVKAVSADRAMGFIPFFAAVRNISEDVAGLPLNVYAKRTDGGRTREGDHPVDTLLHSAPNPYMTAFSFRETLQSHVLMWGNGFAEIEFATDGSVLALWPLRPDRMLVTVDRASGAPVYRYSLNDTSHVDLPRRKVFHVHGLGFDGLVGYSIIEKARRTLAMALASERYGENWYDKGGLPKAVLKHPKTLSDPARMNLRDSVEANYSSLEGRQRIMLLEEGMDLDTLGVPAKDAAFLDTLSDARGLMATLFRMPPDMLQDVTRSTSWGTGIEQQGIGYVKYTLRGSLLRWEQEGDMRLLAGEPRYLKHVVDGLMRGDSTARWNQYRQGLDLGVYSIDDVLEMEDRNPLPDGLGKQHFVQLNRAPLDQIGELSMVDRLAALGGLIRAGFQPDAATDAVELPAIEHTGLEPVTVQAASKSAEVRCTGCNRLLAESASAPYRITCSRCKGVTEAAESVATQDEMVERIAAKVIALMPPPTGAPHVTIAEGAIKTTVNVPPTIIEPGAVAVTVTPPNAMPATVRKEVVRDTKGQITEVIERVE